jgi:hypothetical protein
VRLDKSGNIYLAGRVNSDAFVAKLSSDGSRILYNTTLAGSIIGAIAVGSDGSPYMTGLTGSPDFPATAGSLQPRPGQQPQAFGAKLDPDGKIRYATYIGGPVATEGKAIAVDAAGAAYITGLILGSGVAFPVSPGLITGFRGDTGNRPVTGFVVKLDAEGATAPFSILGFGGNQIALDRDGNILAAGALTGPVPTTSGAFQSSADNQYCGAAFFIGPIPCHHQHIAKIDPTGTHLVFGTYLSGYWGATPAGIAFDSDGNIIVAGVTNSPDYATTARAYQPQYLFDPNQSFIPNANFIPPPPSAFVSKLSPDGTGLIWSTFFSGSRASAASSFQDGEDIAESRWMPQAMLSCLDPPSRPICLVCGTHPSLCGPNRRNNSPRPLSRG